MIGLVCLDGAKKFDKSNHLSPGGIKEVADCTASAGGQTQK